MVPLKIVILKDHSHLMGEVTELDEEPSYLISGCKMVTDEGMSNYPKYTDQRDIFLTSDVILTIVDPSDDAVNEYKKAL